MPLNGTVKMIHDALAAGIQAAHVLMDTWFTNEPFIKKVLDEGIGVIFILALVITQNFNIIFHSYKCRLKTIFK